MRRNVEGEKCQGSNWQIDALFIDNSQFIIENEIATH